MGGGGQQTGREVRVAVDANEGGSWEPPVAIAKEGSMATVVFMATTICKAMTVSMAMTNAMRFYLYHNDYQHDSNTIMNPIDSDRLTMFFEKMLHFGQVYRTFYEKYQAAN